MFGNKTAQPPVDDQLLAFDYVTGVMRGAARADFAQRLVQESELRAAVDFWEEQLMHLSDPLEQRPTDPQVWDAIAARLNTPATPVAPVTPLRPRTAWLWPGLATAASLLLAVCLVLLLGREPLPSSPPGQADLALQQPNADYVAVLTDSSGAPQLTVLTATGGAQLWLKWEGLRIAEDKNLQLWAISKRDGQVRPLGVFADTASLSLPLTQAQWRLIKDASHLLLTEEEVGGSPLDEPSETLIARGACVLLAQQGGSSDLPRL